MDSAMSYEEREDEPAKREQDEAAKIATLTDTEREIVTMVCYGLKNKQVAQQIGASETELRQHLTSIFTKLGVSNRLDLVLYAYAHGLAAIPR